MTSELKKKIRILSEKYSYGMAFEKDIILAKSNAVIRLKSGKKDRLLINYDLEGEETALEIAPEFIFDILMALFERNGNEQIRRNEILITLDVFFEVEPNEKFWKPIFDKCKLEEQTKGISSKVIGGNRILVEYYKGFLIFRDDLSGFASNVVKWG